MDGFYTTNGKTDMGYYKSSDLPYYYSLFPQFTLCANYFCGVLSETYPNRLVLYSGTSSGNISNSINNGTNNTLPQVSFITEAPPYDEHPPSNIRCSRCRRSPRSTTCSTRAPRR